MLDADDLGLGQQLDDPFGVLDRGEHVVDAADDHARHAPDDVEGRVLVELGEGRVEVGDDLERRLAEHLARQLDEGRGHVGAEGHPPRDDVAEVGARLPAALGRARGCG